MKSDNAIVVWRDRETGKLRMCSTNVVWCYPPRGQDGSYELGICQAVDAVGEATPTSAMHAVRDLTERDLRAEEPKS